MFQDLTKITHINKEKLIQITGLGDNQNREIILADIEVIQKKLEKRKKKILKGRRKEYIKRKTEHT